MDSDRGRVLLSALPDVLCHHPQAYQDTFTNIYYFNTLRDNLFGEGGEYAPTEETMADYLPTYIEDNGICWARCILFSTQDCADDAAVAEVQAQAQAVYDELSALSGEALSAAFTERQSQYDTSGYTAGEVQYYTNTDSLVDGFYEGIQALEPGQVGMTEQTDYGYFILLREADQTDDISANAQESYIVTTYDSLISQWTEEYGVSDVAGLELDADAFYTKLSELQQTLSDADTLPTADTSSGDGTTSAGSTSSDGATSGGDASSARNGLSVLRPSPKHKSAAPAGAALLRQRAVFSRPPAIGSGQRHFAIHLSLPAFHPGKRLRPMAPEVPLPPAAPAKALFERKRQDEKQDIFKKILDTAGTSGYNN